MIRSEVFAYHQKAAFEKRLMELADGKGQFTVTPFPDDLKTETRTGWRFHGRSRPSDRANHTQAEAQPSVESNQRPIPQGRSSGASGVVDAQA